MKHLKAISTPKTAMEGDAENILDKILAPVLEISLGEAFGKTDNEHGAE
ncbi:MAG: hypothetical protein ACLFV4_12905 [Candidatus Hydrogenedentota bacterium]